MKILIVAATEFEITPLRKRKKILKKKSVDLLVTGVGMTQTAFALGKIFSTKKIDLAINVGVAGSFRKNIPLGTVVNITGDYFADFGAEDGNKFLTAEEMKLVRSSEFRIRSSGKVTGGRWSVISEIPKVNSITVNTVHGNSASIKKVVNKFNPDIESMEGAAFFYACAQGKIPCLQIRAISNYVERRNKKKWKMDLAIQNLNLFLEKFISEIS